jgi:hypothetical protein
MKVAKGRLRGKKPKLNPRQESHLVEVFETGEHSTAAAARVDGDSPQAVPLAGCGSAVR